MKLREISWAFQMLWGYKLNISINFLLETTAIVSSLAFVFLTKLAIDRSLVHADHQIFDLFVWISISLFLGITLKTIATYRNENLKQKFLSHVQYKLINAQMDTDWKTMRQWQSGDIQYRIQQDAEDMATLLIQTIPETLLMTIRLVASFVFIWHLDPNFAYTLLALFPLLLFSRIYFQKLRSLHQTVKEEEGNLGNLLHENLKFRSLISAMNLSQHRKRTIYTMLQELLSLKNRQSRYMMFTTIGLRFAVNSGYLLTFFWGVLGLMKGKLSFGTVTAFIQLISKVQSPALSLLALAPRIIRSKVSMNRVKSLMDIETEAIPPSIELVAIEKIELQQISFGYETSHILANFSATFKRNKATAILGASGKGKTTLFRLLLGQLEPEQGKILLKSSSQTSRLTNAHRVNFAYVPQGNTLFNGSILDNLSPNNLDPASVNLRHALQIACAEFVYELPAGLHTIVGENGYALSEGQAQRIAVARAILQQKQIMLFDEVTSALDMLTSKQLIHNLKEFGKNRICIYVTHDKYLASICQQQIHI